MTATDSRTATANARTMSVPVDAVRAVAAHSIRPLEWTSTITTRTNGTVIQRTSGSGARSATSSATSEVNGTTTLPDPTLDAVTAGSREVTLDWTLNDNNPGGRTEVRRDTDGTWRDGDDTVVGSVGPGTTTYTDTGRLDGEEYHYLVTRVTTDDDTLDGPITAFSDSSSLSDITDLPAPTNLSADAVCNSEVDLSWADNHNNGDTRIDYKQADASSWTAFATIARNSEAEMITGLLHGKQYDARVAAVTDHATTVDQ